MSGRSGSTSTRGHEARLGFSTGSYIYDDANRKKRETVTTKSYGLNVTRAVLYDYDPDGNRSRLTYPQGNQYIYAYTERNQLDTIKLDPALFGAQPALVNYAYDPSGNRTSRVGPAGAHTEYEIDKLNRIEGQTNYFSGGRSGEGSELTIDTDPEGRRVRGWRGRYGSSMKEPFITP